MAWQRRGSPGSKKEPGLFYFLNTSGTGFAQAGSIYSIW